MRSVILKQRQERDELLARPYIKRDTKYDKQELLSSQLIKLITGPRRVGKSVFAMLLLKETNFAYLNFDDKQLLDIWDEDFLETYNLQDPRKWYHKLLHFYLHKNHKKERKNYF